MESCGKMASLPQYLELRKYSIMLDELFNVGIGHNHDILEKHKLIKRLILGIHYDVVDLSTFIELENSGHKHLPEHRRQRVKYKFATCNIHFEGQGHVRSFQIPMYGGELGKLERDIELAYQAWMVRKEEEFGESFNPKIDDPFIALLNSKNSKQQHITHS